MNDASNGAAAAGGATVFKRISLSIAALVAFTLPVWAEAAPNMIGTWKGIAEGAVLVGSSPYRSGEPGKATFSSKEVEFIFEIDKQEGGGFSGKMQGLTRSETLIGHLYPDGKTGLMLDDDGQFFITLSGPDTMSVCYNHTKPDSKTISCWTAKRSK